MSRELSKDIDAINARVRYRTRKEAGDERLFLRKCYWAMIARCYREGSHNYEHYGARGVKVTKKWRHSYHSFAKWAKTNGWRIGLKIDRIDNDGDYRPNNCRFVDAATSARNRSTTKLSLQKACEVRRLLAEGFTGVEVSQMLALSRPTISQIKHNKIWRI
jgi:hypothetical protein